jgi:hypothetical protein
MATVQQAAFWTLTIITAAALFGLPAALAIYALIRGGGRDNAR